MLLVSLDLCRAEQGASARLVSSRLLQNAHSSALKVSALNAFPQTQLTMIDNPGWRCCRHGDDCFDTFMPHQCSELEARVCLNGAYTQSSDMQLGLLQSPELASSRCKSASHSSLCVKPGLLAQAERVDGWQQHTVSGAGSAPALLEAQAKSAAQHGLGCRQHACC